MAVEEDKKYLLPLYSPRKLNPAIVLLVLGHEDTPLSRQVLLEPERLMLISPFCPLLPPGVRVKLRLPLG